VLFALRQGKEQSEREIVSIIIHLVSEHKNMASMDSRITAQYSRSSQDLPIKVNSFHHCVKDSGSDIFHRLFSLLIKPAELETRARVKVHTGTLMQLRVCRPYFS
jgi:hypothetical protein